MATINLHIAAESPQDLQSAIVGLSFGLCGSLGSEPGDAQTEEKDDAGGKTAETGAKRKRRTAAEIAADSAQKPEGAAETVATMQPSAATLPVETSAAAQTDELINPATGRQWTLEDARSVALPMVESGGLSAQEYRQMLADILGVPVSDTLTLAMLTTPQQYKAMHDKIKARQVI